MPCKEKGFTLIELMVVAAIIAILASIAYPSYIDQVRKSKRATATTDILECAAFLERRFTVNNSYVTTVCDPINTRNTDYALVVTIPSSPASCVTTVNSVDRNNCFLITQTASSGLMLKDTDCKTYTYTNLGIKKVLPSTGTTATTDMCWRS